jgi:nicotinamidase-related amidase
MRKISVGDRDVLIVVDIQNDFCPGGRLSIPRGHEVVPLINHLAERFPHVVLTRIGIPPDICHSHRPIPARSSTTRLRSTMGSRSFGPITAFRPRKAQNFTRT